MRKYYGFLLTPETLTTIDDNVNAKSKTQSWTRSDEVENIMLDFIHNSYSGLSAFDPSIVERLIFTRSRVNNPRVQVTFYVDTEISAQFRSRAIELGCDFSEALMLGLHIKTKEL